MLTKERTSFYCDPMTVKVRGGGGELERIRKDMGDIKELAESIVTYGQLQPIVVDRDMNLICGGRRLAACLLSATPVLVIYNDAIDPVLQREMEVEENIRRKQFTPSEEVLAVQELHRLKTAKYGQASPGKKGGWTLDQTAAVIGKTRGNVIESIQLAKLIETFPELKNAKTKTALRKVAKNLENISAVTAALGVFEKKIAEKQTPFKVFHADARDWLLSQPDGKFDIFITDPPYGISIDKVKMEAGKETGGETASGVKFDDSRETFLGILEYLPAQLYRITKPESQGFMFFAPEFYQPAVDAFRNAGWLPYVRPLIWNKLNYSQCNVPHLYPASAYEMILFVRKEKSLLVKEGLQDVISLVPFLNKTHPTEKPIQLIENLLERIALPGYTIIDPFMGSGAILHAAVKQKLFAEGCDILKEYYAMTLSRLTSLLEEDDDSKH